jgi:hypothetical protein
LNLYHHKSLVGTFATEAYEVISVVAAPAQTPPITTPTSEVALTNLQQPVAATSSDAPNVVPDAMPVESSQLATSAQSSVGLGTIAHQMPATTVTVVTATLPPNASRAIRQKGFPKSVDEISLGKVEAAVPAYRDPKTDAPNTLVEALGPEAVAVSEQLIAENEGVGHPDQLSIARELGITDKQYLEVKRHESILRKGLSRADRVGANAFRTLLLNDHATWLREYLGHDKAERYKELSQ